MKRFGKVLSVALSLMLVVNFTALETSAEEGANRAQQNPSKTSTEYSDGQSGGETVGNTDGSKENTEEDISTEDSSGKVTPGEADKKGEDKENQKPKDDTDNEETSDDGISEDISDKKQVKTDGNYISDLEAVTEGKDTVKLEWNIKDEEDIVSGFDVALYTDERLDKEIENLSQSVEKEKENQEKAEAVVKGVNAGVTYYAAVTPYSVDDAGEKTEAEAAVIKVLTLSAPVLSAKTAEGKVTLNWTAVSGAQSYEIYQISGSVKTLLTKVTGKTTYTHNVSKNNTVYNYIVVATASGATAAESNQVSATPRTVKPGKVTNLNGMDGEKKATLTWSKASNATSYYVYRYNSSKKSWTLIKQLTGTSYTDNKLTAGKTYKYRVAAVRTKLGETVRGDMTSTLSVSVKKTPGTKVYPMKYKATVKSTAPCFSSKNGKKKVKYLKPGTKVTTIDSGNGRYKVKLSNGKTYWVAKGRLKITASVWTTKDYSTQTKTNFVNSKGYKSSSKYLIWISQYTQRVIIYQGSKGKWKVIRSCRCATGTYLHKTPKGTFKITYKEKGWFYKTTYEKPIVHFKGANSFHSRIKNYKGGYADPTIGRPKSKGCVRLYDSDINFIYKNCPKGTTVVSY